MEAKYIRQEGDNLAPYISVRDATVSTARENLFCRITHPDDIRVVGMVNLANQQLIKIWKNTDDTLFNDSPYRKKLEMTFRRIGIYPYPCTNNRIFTNEECVHGIRQANCQIEKQIAEYDSFSKLQFMSSVLMIWNVLHADRLSLP